MVFKERFGGKFTDSTQRFAADKREKHAAGKTEKKAYGRNQPDGGQAEKSMRHAKPERHAGKAGQIKGKEAVPKRRDRREAGDGKTTAYGRKMRAKDAVQINEGFVDGIFLDDKKSNNRVETQKHAREKMLPHQIKLPRKNP